jgi:hypothetical protein
VPAIPLPEQPNLAQLRNKARDLQRAVRAGDPDALALAAEFNPGGPESLSYPLSAAQLVLARRYGCASWPRLRRYVEIVTYRRWNPRRPAPDEGPATAFLRLVCGGLLSTDAVQPADDLRRARQLLAQHPELPAVSLAVAAACCDVAAVRAHLAADPSQATRASEPYGWPPLLYLARAGHDPQVRPEQAAEVAQLLLAAGADPNDGRFQLGMYLRPNPVTALGGALFAGGNGRSSRARAMVLGRVLLEADADPNDGSAANLVTHGENDDELLELLFEFGLGQATGHWHRLLGEQMVSSAVVLRELLFYAIDRNQQHRVALLARHGVDLASPFTEMGSSQPHRWPAGTPAAVALINGYSELAGQLASRGAPALEPGSADAFVAAVIAGDDVVARSASAEVIETVRTRWPGLPAWAARRGTPESVPLLVGAGFDVNALGRSDGPYDQRWHSALHVAAENGNLRLAQRLLDLGADPDLRDALSHETPLTWAQRSGHRALIDLLEPLTMG